MGYNLVQSKGVDITPMYPANSSNRMLVIDPDPNGVGHAPDNGSNAIIVGSVLLTTANKSSHFEMDGHIFQ